MAVNNLPKVELHCHLLGILSPQLLTQLKQQGTEILVDPAQLAMVYPVNHTGSFAQWLECTRPYQTNRFSYLLPVLKHHIDQLIVQQVVYAELMISPAIFSNDLDTMSAELAGLKEWCSRQDRRQTQIEFLMTLPRTLPDELLKKDTQTFIQLFRQGLIAGVALVGIENNTSIERFSSSFRLLKDHGLGIEIHAGEHSGPECVWEAINHGYADRIGHGISLFQDEKLINTIKERNIHLEFCLTSNLRTGSVGKPEAHPVTIARELQLSYSINTDDPGIFECTLNSEYELLERYFHFPEEELKRIFERSLQARFQKDLRYTNTSLANP